MRYDDGGEYDNGDASLLFGIAVALYVLGTLIWNFGWETVLVGALCIAGGIGCVVACVAAAVGAVRLYLGSELHRYRQARRDIKRIIRAGRKQIRSL